MKGFPQEELHHEMLYRQLQRLAKTKDDLDHKMRDWEVDYQALREVENSLIEAYDSLESKPH